MKSDIIVSEKLFKKLYDMYSNEDPDLYSEKTKITFSSKELGDDEVEFDEIKRSNTASFF